MESEKLVVKENVVRRPPLPLGWLAAAAALTAAALGAAALVDVALPVPLLRASAPRDRFIAEIAHEHLVNLTSIGPRVAGSYENDVLGVGAVAAAVRAIAAAAPHARLDLDVHTASGAFPLAFLDGMNHVYQDVTSVVVRLSGAGAGGAVRRRSALLLNCHIDTVPDSPGGSDDAAGCAVLLETLRALAASGAPRRHDVVFLFNAAEENVLQASHAFITQHKWARSVRAFINVEACGAGGREVLFQAGPRQPWIVEVYAGAVPHPFASSLAQEMFESGLIPADTDFRIFRDFGNLSGVDLAWSANGYVYHTALDTAARVRRDVLQRTGDNVLALARGMLSSARLSAAQDEGGQPVYFDVLGAVVLSARAPAAALLAALALLLLALDVHATARRARTELFVGYWWWWRAAARGGAACACAAAAGLGAAAALAGALHALHARLTFYSRPWLLAPLYALPAVASSWWAALRLARRCVPGGAGGWWAARALQQGGTLLAGAALLLCWARGLRSGFVPWLWTALPAAAGCGAGAARRRAPAWWWAGGAALPVLQTWYLALGSLRMLVPMTGRAGSTPLPPDVLVALVTAALALAACSWLLPLVVAARDPHKLIVLLWCACACGCAVSLCACAGGAAGGAYSRAAPQRLMVFHVRRTTHPAPPAPAAPAAPAAVETFYWIPQLDVNTPHSVAMYAAEMAEMAPVPAAECAAWPYCGVPYYLPVQSLVPQSHRARARAAPAPRLHCRAELARDNATHARLLLHAHRGPAHVVLIVSLARGVTLRGTSALPRPAPSKAPGGGGDTYFFALFSARAPHRPLTLLLQREHAERARGGGGGGGAWARVSAAGHAMFGAQQRSAEHAALLRRLPPWTQRTGWGVDMHLYTL